MILLNTSVCWRRCLKISQKNGLISLFTNLAGTVILAGLDPGVSPTARAPVGQLVPGHLSLGLLAHINILYEIFVFSRSVLELWPVVE